MDFDTIMVAVYKILGAAIGTILVSYGTILLNKLKNKLQNTIYMNFIKECVKAAEQLYPNINGKTGQEKYDYVMNQILIKYPKLAENINLKVMIESMVYEVCNPNTQHIEEVKEELTKTVKTQIKESTKEIKEQVKTEVQNNVNKEVKSKLKIM